MVNCVQTIHPHASTSGGLASTFEHSSLVLVLGTKFSYQHGLGIGYSLKHAFEEPSPGGWYWVPFFFKNFYTSLVLVLNPRLICDWYKAGNIIIPCTETGIKLVQDW